MALGVVGSNPIIHPIIFTTDDAQFTQWYFLTQLRLASDIGASPNGKAEDFDSSIAGSTPAVPAIHGSLAQSVEHLPFKQGVRGSNPR